MRPPRIDAVGLLEPGDGIAGPAKRPLVRVFAALLLLAFVVAVIVTGTVSAGRFCLTTDAGRPVPGLDAAAASPAEPSRPGPGDEHARGVVR